ncbi:VanZ family protein [Clostridium lundense]|uniref:VanZ family protein n=1 Tax=Clostridium lundense TaxID=319475 RepID=UPI00048678AE|nr:VanZ family protein [Clostridium lundense]
MKKLNYKILFKYLLVLLWMSAIFKFSADPADVSDGKSGLVIQLLTSLGVDVNGILGNLTNFIVRKVAHFTEYFILSLLLINALKENYNLNKTLKFAILITFLYACSDEFHQLFVPGRSGRFKDVLIDTSGGLLVVLILKCIEKIKNRKE